MQKIVSFAQICLLLLLAQAASAATYSVSVAGSDVNTGTTNQPWRTIAKAASAVAPGDTVLVQPGLYDELVIFSSGGTAINPITFSANGPVTNRGTWYIQASYLTFNGFDHDYGGTNIYYTPMLFGKRGATNVWVINNKFHDMPVVTYPFAAIDFETSQGHTNIWTGIVISNNYFWNYTGGGVNLRGYTNICVNNWLSNSMGCDAFNVFGHDHIIRSNRCYEINSKYGAIEHPDFIQTFGPLVTLSSPDWGLESWNILVEDNICINTDNYTNAQGGAIAQLECNNGTNAPTVHDWTFRNNVFAGFNVGASVDIPNCRWYNNTFYECNPQGSVINYAFINPNGRDPRGEAYGGAIINNAFIACGFTSQYLGWYGQMVDTSYTPNPAPDLFTNCDYNFVCQLDFSSKMVGTGYPSTDPFKFSEPHGINGGDPKLSNPLGGDFGLLAGSVLIDTGKTIASVTVDIAGVSRPQGLAYDIGAYEYNGTSSPVAPSITSQPQSTTVSLLAAATFSVTASGTAPLSYQWLFNGLSIPGATGSSYTIPSVALGAVGSYSVAVTNSVGLVNSTVAILSISAAAVPPSITSQPQSLTVTVGGDVSFTVRAAGTAPLSYQWVGNGSSISGATTSVYSLSNVQPANAASYSVLVSNSAGVASSASASLTVLAVPYPPTGLKVIASGP